MEWTIEAISCKSIGMFKIISDRPKWHFAETAKTKTPTKKLPKQLNRNGRNSYKRNYAKCLLNAWNSYLFWCCLYFLFPHNTVRNFNLVDWILALLILLNERFGRFGCLLEVSANRNRRFGVLTYQNVFRSITSNFLTKWNIIPRPATRPVHG